jgi:cytidyltransferase-like protein
MSDIKIFDLEEFKSLHSKGYVCCIFGGSFDPIHEGHIVDIKTLLSICNTVIIAPTAQNPWKDDNPVDLSLRLKMIELVLDAENIKYSKDFKQSGLVVSHLPYTYSIEFLNLVREKKQDSKDKILWAIGEDLKDVVLNWKDWQTDGVDLLVLPTLPGYSSTSVRTQRVKPHSALADFIAKNRLYIFS